ncbi:MAG: ABC transporter ATP-binding protein [Gammaproteobacteria bacterium]|nr:ABC transporter ATP-binding protein [Gammaproteobacteria bacterium]
MSIVINNLSKKYGHKEVLKDLSYSFVKGGHYLIKGENGIGKSTLLKSILNQIKYRGELNIEGKISYAPEDPILPSYMNVYSFIKTFSTLYEDNKNIDKEIEEQLNLYKLKGYERKQLGSLSKGEKMKINIIQAILSKSDILLLDEPLSGLDKDSKKVLLKSIKEDTRTVIVISHETTAFRRDNFIKLRVMDGKIVENT